MENIKKILITVLSFLVLFSISCDNEGKTGSGGISGGENGGGGSSGGSQSKSELVGDWIYKSNTRNRSFKVDNNGNITFNIPGQIVAETVSYVGKINDTFDYPYTVEVVATYNGKTKNGTFTFNSASSCDTIYYLVSDYGEFINLASSNTFTKN